MTRRRWIYVVAAALALAGCTATPEPAPPASPTSSLSLDQYGRIRQPISTVRWTGDRALLMTPDGTFIRAYWESFSIAILEGGGPDEEYPGFRDAVNGVLDLSPDYHELHYHTDFAAIAWTTTLPDGTGRTLVCDWSDYKNGTQKEGGAIFVDYRRTGTPPPANQFGTARKPVGNVFGDWTLVADDMTANMDPANRAACAGNGPATPVQPDEPALPPYPGWPEPL